MENTQKSPPNLLTRADVEFRKNLRARRFIARVDKKGLIVLTIPGRGTQKEALAFANLHAEWLRNQQIAALKKNEERRPLASGDLVLFEGNWSPLLVVVEDGCSILTIGRLRKHISGDEEDQTLAFSQLLKEEAQITFPPRVQELAGYHRISFNRVTIRGQKTRWGSCSRNGSISLNWKLMQAPVWVRDYVILHELMHIREMNHSDRFWSLVSRTCPDYKDAEKWLNQHAQSMIE